MGLFIGTPSYDGEMSFNVISTREILPDIEFFMQCIQDSVDELKLLADEMPDESKTPGAQRKRRRAAAKAKPGAESKKAAPKAKSKAGSRVIPEAKAKAKSKAKVKAKVKAGKRATAKVKAKAATRSKPKSSVASRRKSGSR